MKIYALLSAATLVAGSVFAGPETIIRERAKQLRDENNARQGVPPPAKPGQPAQRPAQPGQPAQQAPAAVAAAPQTPLARLQADLAAIRPNAQPTADQRQQLARDLIATAQGPAKPSSASAAKLAGDLAAALAEKPLSSQGRSRLVQNLNAVLNPASMPAWQMEAVITDIGDILKKNGLDGAKATAISAQVKTISAEVQKTAK